jgi:hypothetical protein
MNDETEVRKQDSVVEVFASKANIRLGNRTIEVERFGKQPLHKIEAKWLEGSFEPHGWITLETVVKKPMDEWRKIIQAYLARVGKIHKQHVHAIVRGGVQRKSFEKNKIHFHILYRFERRVVCTRVMELMWKQVIRKILRKGGKPTLNDLIEAKEMKAIIKSGVCIDLPKKEKGFYAHAYEYKRINDPDNKGTMIQYTIDPIRHPTDWYLVGCPKCLSRCRRGKCEHHKREHMVLHS